MAKKQPELRQAAARVSAEEYERLERVARKNERTVAQEIRVALREHLDREER